jgi:hypothetical protein
MHMKISDMMDCIQDDTVLFELNNIASSDKIKEITMNKLHSETKARKPSRKLCTVLVAAALTVTLLAGTAFATGSAQSVFAAMKGHPGGAIDSNGKQYEINRDSDYEAMDNLSNKEEQIVEIPKTTGSTPGSFTLSQSFYDGEHLAIGYNLDALIKPAVFGFGPGHEKFGELENIEDKVNHTVLVINLQEYLTEAEYERFSRELDKNGSAGVIYYSQYFGDHITLADGTDITTPSAENNGVAYTSTELDNGVFLEFSSPLNEAALNKAELNIFMSLRCATCYYYQDSSGAYYYFDPPEKTQIALTIPRSK